MRTMPARVPVLTLLAVRAGAGIAARRVGAGGVPWAHHPLRTLVDICQGNAAWHREKYLGWGPTGTPGLWWLRRALVT